MDAGSPSIALLNTDERVFPLNLHETVTPHLFSVGDQVEWRVLHAQGKQTPGALIVRVAAHEEAADPGRVTHTYVAVAKISPSAVCVTDVLSEGSQPEAEIRLLADSALSKSCVPSFPSMAALRDPS
jgi:hypothetical protein